MSTRFAPQFGKEVDKGKSWFRLFFCDGANAITVINNKEDESIKIYKSCRNLRTIFLYFSRLCVLEQYEKCASKVLRRHIVNTHFRYQLRKVEFKVGIFLYWLKL